MTDPVHVQIRNDAALGAAWRRCEAALPKGWVMWTLRPGAFTSSMRRDMSGIDRTVHAWEAETLGPLDQERGHGITPLDALNALADALEAR